MDSAQIKHVKEGWDIVEEITDYINAIGRIPGRGTAVMISKPNAARAVLLTTSFAFQESIEALNGRAVFLETPALGTHVKAGGAAPVEMALRPDVFFFCSAKPGRELYRPKVAKDPTTDDEAAHASTTAAEEAETLGYTVVACNVAEGQGPQASLRNVVPLPLPLILSKLPSVNVGDKHLVITHADAITRKFYVLDVREVHHNHCVYGEADPTAHFASGGPIFTTGGEFVGVHHQSGEINLGIFIKDVVRHLFDSAMLAPCHIPVLDSNDEAANDDDPHDANRPISVDEHNAPLSILQRQRLMDVGAGDQLVNFDDLERARKNKLRPRKESLVVRRHLEIWKEWYTDYRSLVLLLHAFPHHTKLLRLVLVELTCHGQRANIDKVSRLGGIGILLEALDTHPYDEELMIAGTTALGRISLFDENRDAIARCDGVTAVTNILREYCNTATIQQWGTYCVLNLVHGMSRSSDCIAQFVQHGGIPTLISNLRKYAGQRYIIKWSSHTLGYVVAEDKAFFDIAIKSEICGVLCEQLRAFATDGFVVVAQLFLLHQLTRFEQYSAAVDHFSRAQIMLDIAAIIRHHTKEAADAQLLEYAACVVRNLVAFASGENIAAAIEANVESALVDATLTWLSEPRLHVAVAAALTQMGISDAAAKYTHLQLGPSSALSD